jgi:hypothetical protein
LLVGGSLALDEAPPPGFDFFPLGIGSWATSPSDSESVSLDRLAFNTSDSSESVSSSAGRSWCFGAAYP